MTDPNGLHPNRTQALAKRKDEVLERALANELEWVRSNPKARQAKSKARLKRYDEMLSTPVREELAHSARIYIPPGPRLGEQVIDASDLKKGFGERQLIDGLTFSIPRGAIVGIVGPNGAGKTTLINMLLGRDTPDGGSLIVGGSVKMVSIEQTREGLNDAKSVFDEVSDGFDNIKLGEIEVASRAYCSWFGFKSGDQQKKVAQLSGGERNRLQLAKLLKSGANLILMDEPTNDLDVNTIRSLEEASLASLMPIFPACHTLFPLYMTGFFFSIPQTGHS